MSKISFKSVVIAAIALVVPVVASANDEVRALIQNPNYWAYPGGDYNNHRYTELKQINNKNVGKLQAAWTFSTGVLRGHEGGPLVGSCGWCHHKGSPRNSDLSAYPRAPNALHTQANDPGAILVECGA